MNNNIHELKLHEGARASQSFSITRVPGGWIYTYHDHHSVFVPFNREFKEPSALQKKIARAWDLLKYLWSYRIAP